MTKTDSETKYVIKEEKTIAEQVEENMFMGDLTEMSLSLATARSLLRCQMGILYNNYVIILKWGPDCGHDIRWLDVDHELNKLYAIIYKGKKCIYYKSSLKIVYTVMFDQFFEYVSGLTRNIKWHLKKYHGLPELRSDAEVHAVLEKIYRDLSKDIAKGSFTTSLVYIEKYL